jgi:hypothetical protein
MGSKAVCTGELIGTKRERGRSAVENGQCRKAKVSRKSV